MSKQQKLSKCQKRLANKHYYTLLVRCWKPFACSLEGTSLPAANFICNQLFCVLLQLITASSHWNTFLFQWSHDWTVRKNTHYSVIVILELRHYDLNQSYFNRILIFSTFYSLYLWSQFPVHTATHDWCFFLKLATLKSIFLKLCLQPWKTQA